MEIDIKNKNSNLLNISNLIQSTIELIKIQLNPFLIDEIKKYFNLLTLENFTVDKIPDHFPKLINLKIESQITQINELNGNENRIKELNVIRPNLEYLKQKTIY